MAATQAIAKGSVGSLGRRRGAVAARVGGSWRKTPLLGDRLAVGPRRSRPVSRILVTSPAQVIQSPEYITLISKDSFFFVLLLGFPLFSVVKLFYEDRDELSMMLVR